MNPRLRRTSRLPRAGRLLQSEFWGRFKALRGARALRLEMSWEGGQGALLVLLDGVGGGRSRAYVPFGPDAPVPTESQGPFLEELSEALRPHLPEGCLFVRYDLPWASPYAEEGYFGEAGRWPGAPSPRVRELRMNFGCRRWNLRKAPTDLLPPDTAIVDLRVTEEEILARMRANTRAGIRRAEKRGLRVRQAPAEELPVWYDLYRQTAQRHGLRCEGPDYFQSLFTAAGGCPDGPELRMLLAEAEGRSVAGVIVALYGRRATYLYGASSGEKRELMPSHGLQWQAFRAARQAGCTAYDLFGVAPGGSPAHPLHGVHVFKTGFGGTVLHRRGSWDYPYRREEYSRYRSFEIAASPGGETP